MPVVSVGALNPNGTDALFSNAGPWVAAYRPGASVMSTMPRFQGGYLRGPSTGPSAGRGPRSTRTTTRRFRAWTGTSFTAPLLAGLLARQLSEGLGTPLTPPMTPPTRWTGPGRQWRRAPNSRDDARVLSAEELHHQGVLAYNRGRHTVAERLFARAREGLEPGDLLARVELSQAYLLAERGDTQAALDLCALALARPGLSDPTRGTVHSQVGLLQMLRGEGEGGARAVRRRHPAARRRRAARARPSQPRRGAPAAQRSAGRPSPTSRRPTSATRPPVTTTTPPRRKHNLGYALLLEGDLVGALHELDEAYRVLRHRGAR